MSNSSELSNYNTYLAQRPYIRQAIIAIIAVLLRNMSVNEYASNISTYRTYRILSFYVASMFMIPLGLFETYDWKTIWVSA